MKKIEKAKIEAVIEYLRGEFPGCQIGGWDDFDSISCKFSVDNDSALKLRIRKPFMKNTKDIKLFLRSSEVAESMRNMGQVLINNNGEIKLDEGQA